MYLRKSPKPAHRRSHFVTSLLLSQLQPLTGKIVKICCTQTSIWNLVTSEIRSWFCKLP